MGCLRPGYKGQESGLQVFAKHASKLESTAMHVKTLIAV